MTDAAGDDLTPAQRAARLCSTTGMARAQGASLSAFQRPSAAVKSAIATKFSCAWRAYQDAGQQCGDELVVLNQRADGQIESIELTCSIRPKGKATAKCRDQVMWIASAFLPSWPGRNLWLADLFHVPPSKGRWIKTSVKKATVLAQTEGPADLEATNIVFGITNGDPLAWDLPR